MRPRRLLPGLLLGLVSIVWMITVPSFVTGISLITVLLLSISSSSFSGIGFSLIEK